MHNFPRPYAHVNRHPLARVRELIDFNIRSGFISQHVSLNFSKYRYVPQSFSDYRVSFGLPFYQLNESVLFNIFSDLNEGEELAFHSEVRDFGNIYHIPLIDFGKIERGVIDSTPLRELSDHWNMAFYIYNSGRSYHAYGNRLISPHEWVQFMGSLLLLNRPSGFKLIDERWVGHRIMAGYSALRWSNNSSNYKKSPTFIGFLNIDGFHWE